ncbi:MAG: hypothetical protein Q4A30_00005 [Candidatus Saccharibacteria bacterium]|nr:hypothetical protein [Candidatus Saccharibacteria bacterium]
MVKTKLRAGFTVIEVSIFLAISALLLVSIMAGTSISIARRRYTDAVNDITDYLRRAYAEVINVQNSRLGTTDQDIYCTVSTMFDPSSGHSVVKSGSTDNFPGRTNCIIYGKLITFGEQGSTNIHSYDIIGRIHRVDIDNQDNAITALEAVGANVVTVQNLNQVCTLGLAGNANVFEPRWQASLINSKTRKLYQGSVMIVRSPISGTVQTYYSQNTIPVQQTLADKNQAFFGNTGCLASELRSRYSDLHKELLMKELIHNTFTKEDATFCVDSDDFFALSSRRAIRIKAEGRNTSGVELLPVDSQESLELCQ